ncbi:MAG: TIGR02453 family protein [Candidatus Krumholzibacteriia bacterium]
MAKPYFTRGLFDFLKDLEGHNDRDWFQANKERYEEHLKEPALRFIGDFGPQVRAVSPHLVCDPRPNGGSLFRIYRDIRFSKDKRPYKTHCAIQFRHEAGKDAHAPGLYLHLENGGSFLAAGTWRPPTTECRTIREAIAAAPARWRAAVGELDQFGEQLTRVPAGYAKDHPAADALRYKDFGVWRTLSRQDVLAADAPQRIGQAFLAMKPVMAFLCKALGHPF